MFRFKQFTVSNDRAAMRVGTDGVLLGAWTAVEGASRVLDVGTGTGVVALMIAQRARTALIEAIDIDADAVGEASDNFARSPWSDRLSASQCAFQHYRGGPFDLIVCNPPYYNGHAVTGEARAHARHSASLTLENLIVGSRQLLSPCGSLALVLPADLDADVRCLAVVNRLHVARHTAVCTVPGRPAKRSLWQLSVERVEPVSSTLVLNTPEHAALVSDFLLDAQ